jgi:glycyl-tRNA synthetase
MFLATLSQAYREEKLEDGTSRVVLKLPPFLAPTKVAVMPLTKKDGLPEKAEEILQILRLDHQVVYDEKDSIGKRYRRQDALGTPFCVTIDHESLQNHTVTVRHRDSMAQERIAIDQVPSFIDSNVSIRKALISLV